jgi:ribosome maturation factor RimP
MALNDWNNKIADLINSGLSDEEISDYFDANDAIPLIRDYCAEVSPPGLRRN